VRAAAPDIGFVVSIGPSDFGEDYDALVERYADQAAPMASVEYDDPCWFFFTSGTTGRPKAAVLTHGQMAFVINNHIADLMPGLSQHSRSLVLAPLSHGAGIHALVNVARGAACVRVDDADAGTLRSRINAEDAGHVTGLGKAVAPRRHTGYRPTISFRTALLEA